MVTSTQGEGYTLREEVNDNDAEGKVLSRHRHVFDAMGALIERRHVNPFLGMLAYVYDEEKAERVPSAPFFGLGNWRPLLDEEDGDHDVRSEFIR